MSELYSTSRLDHVIEEIIMDKSGGLNLHNIKTKYYIDMGEDSFVCKFGKDVYKFYGKGCVADEELKERIEFYQRVTNEASKFSKQRQLSLKMKENTYALVINPITEVLTSESFQLSDTSLTKYKAIVGVSPFVGGERLQDTYVYDHRRIASFLHDVSGEIMNELGIAGISIIDYNVKISRDILTVTDLCPRLSRLRDFGKSK